MRTIKGLTVSCLLSLSLCSLTDGSAQAMAQRSLLALSKTEHMLAIVDPLTLKVTARLPVGEDPHEVIASSDGKTAYVTIYGGGSLHELDIIDLVSQKPVTNLDTRPLYGPHGITFANGKVYLTAEGSKAVASYDPATGKLDWSMGTGQDRTHMIYVTPDAKKIYTTNVSSGTVSILTGTILQPNQPSPPGAKPRESWTQTIIPTAVGSEGFDVSPDGSQLWTASSQTGVISIIDLTEKKLAQQLDAKTLGANRLKFTPDGKQVFITSLSTGILYIYDTQSHKEIKKIQTGHGAAGILMDPEGHRAFVACSNDNNIAVIDLKSLTITGHLDVGGVPDGMAWAVR
jgi:DNA-binding beta-propeller fold protein YncE